ncbi:MAG: cytochrome c family protein [Desulfobulbaceae bacterium]|nr:cytochrome c family protein [Desulfobulbaceae bacterium]
MKSAITLLAVLLLTAGAAGTGYCQSKVFDVDRDMYPYYPSLIKWNKSHAGFTPPEVCGECHEQQYEEWTGSVHALAFKDPVYQGELNKAVKAIGHDISRQCEGCHSAAGVVTGEIKKPGLAGLSPMALAGVSCDICHSISGTTHWQTPSHEPENGSMILTPGVETTEGGVLIKRGPFAPDEGCGDGFHQCEESSLHLRAELCASCHQVYHYDAHFPLEATYLEWKHGPYAQNEILCQDCHMVATETFLRSADTFTKPEKSEYHHYFNGANYLLYFLAEQAANKAGDKALAANVQQKYGMAVDRLKAAADLEITPVYRENRLAEVKVRVKNIRAGHNLPTSLTNVRQMWLELTATTPDGKVLFSSGTVDETGRLAENTRLFNSDGMGDDFHFAIDPWIVTAFSRHDTIPPRGYKDVYYGISMPDNLDSVKVEARLRYRQADQAVAEALLAAVPEDMDLETVYGIKEVPQLPIVDMVVVSADLAAVKK